MGLQLFAITGELIYESAWKGCYNDAQYDSCETIMVEGEKIVGIKSVSNPLSPGYANHCSLIFTIGRCD